MTNCQSPYKTHWSFVFLFLKTQPDEISKNYPTAIRLSICFVESATAQSDSSITQRQINLAGLQLEWTCCRSISWHLRWHKSLFQLFESPRGVHGRRIEYTTLTVHGRQNCRTTYQKYSFSAPNFGDGRVCRRANFRSHPDWVPVTGIPDLFGLVVLKKKPVEFFLSNSWSRSVSTGKFCAENLVENVLVWFRDDQKQLTAGVFWCWKRRIDSNWTAEPSTLFNLEKELDQLVAPAPDAIVVLGPLKLTRLFGSIRSGCSNLCRFWDRKWWMLDNLIEVLNRVAFLSYLPMLQQIDHPGITLHRRLLNEYAPGQEMTHWTLVGHAIAETTTELLTAVNSSKSIPIDNHVTASWWMAQSSWSPWNFP